MRGDPEIISRLKQYSPADLAFCTITLAEILYGIEKSQRKKKKRRYKIEQVVTLLKLYAFDQAAARAYAVIRAQLERQGLLINERDTQIAAIAGANDLTVVTHNVKEFARVKNLRVQDWATQSDKESL